MNAGIRQCPVMLPHFPHPHPLFPSLTYNCLNYYTWRTCQQTLLVSLAIHGIWVKIYFGKLAVFWAANIIFFSFFFSIQVYKHCLEAHEEGRLLSCEVLTPAKDIPVSFIFLFAILELRKFVKFIDHINVI